MFNFVDISFLTTRSLRWKVAELENAI